MKKVIVLLLVLTVFANCKPVQLVVCKYSGFDNYLTLKDDNTFEYEFRRGWYYNYVLVEGTWSSEKNLLLLDSRDTLMQAHLPLNVIESKAVGVDSLKFILDEPLWYVNWILILNGVSYPLINDSVVTLVDTFAVKRFYLTAERDNRLVPGINRETIRTQTYTLQNENGNLVELSTPLTGREVYRYASYELLNDTLEIKKGELIWKRKNVVLKPFLKEED